MNRNNLIVYRIGSVSSCGIINNGNPLLSAPETEIRIRDALLVWEKIGTGKKESLERDINNFTPVVKDAKNGSDGDKKGKENASDDSGGGTSRFLVFLN